jgi:hypothetical protein
VEAGNPSDRAASAGPAGGADMRLLALRHAAQEASDFSLGDDTVRRFIELRDRGASHDEIAAELGVQPDVVEALVRADDAQATAHRIATGQEPMYPAPAPEDVVQDNRLGSATVPALALVVVLIGVILYAVLR